MCVFDRDMQSAPLTTIMSLSFELFPSKQWKIASTKCSCHTAYAACRPPFVS